MITKYYNYPSSNGENRINATVWLPENDNILGVLQICHGMNEHSGRYENFAEFMTDNGYAVCINNHLGHGNCENSIKGYFGDHEGYKFLVKDVHRLYLAMKAKYNNIPYFLLGHSMGSFVVRMYCAKYAKCPDGIILSGTGKFSSIINAGILLTKVMNTMKLGNREAKIIHFLSALVYKKKLKNTSTKYDWLSSDDKIVDAFINDEKTMFIFTYAGYLDLFTMIKKVSDSKWSNSIPKDLPIYLFSGEDDPVGEYGEGVKTVCQNLTEAGCVDVTLKLYKEGRHEMLNEINRYEVYNDVLEWMNTRLEK